MTAVMFEALDLLALPDGVGDYDDVFVTTPGDGTYHDLERDAATVACGVRTGPNLSPGEYERGYVTAVWRAAGLRRNPCPDCYPTAHPALCRAA